MEAAEQNAVELVGYVGAGSRDQSVRLYKSVAMDSPPWLEIGEEAIVASGPAEGYEEGESRVLVRRDANLVLCKLVPAYEYDEGPPAAPGGPGTRRWPRR